jgi:hypothetical protein
MKKLALMLGTAAILAASGAAYADTIVLQDQDRVLLTDYLYINNKGCPAGSTAVKREHWMGLAKPTYRCVVPKNSNMVVYKPGTALPATVTYTELPKYIVESLPPPPSGEVYVSTDAGVYLINPQTRTVVDSVTIVGTE